MKNIDLYIKKYIFQKNIFLEITQEISSYKNVTRTYCTEKASYEIKCHIMTNDPYKIEI